MKRAATIEPSATSVASPQSQANSAMRPQTRSATARPEVTQGTWSPPAAATLKDPQAPQNVAEVIVMKPENLQPTIEGRSHSPVDNISRTQRQSERSTPKSADRTLSSKISKTASKGRKSEQRSRSRGNTQHLK